MDTKKTTEVPAELTATAGQSPALSPVAEPVPANLATEADDKKRWLIVAGPGSISGDRGAGVIVVESHEDPKVDDDGQPVMVRDAETGELVQDSSHLVTSGYAKGADLYIRQSPDVEFPADAHVLTIGDELDQVGFSGFASKPGYVRVGPASAAYAAANLAWQRGATDIKIVGLSGAQKEQLQPYIDGLPNHPNGPADVKITLA